MSKTRRFLDSMGSTDEPRRSRRRRSSRSRKPAPSRFNRKFVFAVLPALLFYLVIELVATMVAWFCWWDNSLWVFEDSGRTWHFDAVRGYRLTPVPSRFARITNGVVEYVGTAQGNAQGFADHDDFRRERPSSGTRRIAVFGDSFTEAQYLKPSWPDRAEELARQQGQPVQLLNFGVSGGGLANWWSTLTKIVADEGYEVDAVVFAVFPGDLRRRFSMWEHRGVTHPLFGRVPGWDPRTYPITLTEARPFLEEHPALILSSKEFERTVNGHWPRGVPRRLRPFFLTQLWRLVRNRGVPSEALPPAAPIEYDRDRARLVSDIRQFLVEHRLPALVISIPDRGALLDPARAPDWPRQDAEQFAAEIGAAYLDATPEYSSLTRSQIRAQYLPYDGHWSQAGSDRFAAFVLKNLDSVRSGGRTAQAQAASAAGSSASGSH